VILKRTVKNGISNIKYYLILLIPFFIVITKDEAQYVDGA